QIGRPLSPLEQKSEQKDQKLELSKHICGWSYSTSCTLCGLPQHVEKYSKFFIAQGVVTVSCNLDALYFLQISHDKHTIC
uniref:Uncharacterized protein n=1 Tax=Ursus americanus TaxID=9643 RepID=A0A452SQ59_URSAM